MKMKRRFTNCPLGYRPGLSMLEMVIAGSMLTLVMTSLSVVLRTTRQSWEANDNDYASLHQAHAVVRHFVRQARESTGVSAMAVDGSSISLILPSGDSMSWSHANTSGGLQNVVNVGISSSGTETPLAHNIRVLSFTGYKADGVTLTANITEMRLIEVSVSVSLPRGNAADQTVRSKVLIRSW